MKSSGVKPQCMLEGQDVGRTARVRGSSIAMFVAVSCSLLGCGGEAWSPEAEETASDGPNAPTSPPSEPLGAWGLEALADDTAGSGLPAPEASSRLHRREPVPVGAGGLVYTWGSTSVLFRDEPGNLRLLGNVLSSLAGTAPSGNSRILYTSDCDPREHENLCKVADDPEALVGFFETVAEHGTITFDTLSASTANENDLVIFDACTAGSGSPAQLRRYLADGGRALILADNFCNRSAPLMNDALPNLGLTFTDADPSGSELFVLPPEARTGLLEGVEALDIFRVVPQLITHSFTPVVESPNGILMARREGPAAR